MADNTGADILNTVENWLSTYIKTAQDSDLYVLTLWAAHTHLCTETYTSPRLLLDSPAPGAGKTTTLDHLQRLCHKPVQAASLSSPSLLARLLEKGPRTILVDEADRTLSPKMDGVGELLAVLNSGYRRGASRPVLVPDKEEGWVAREMSTFGPVAMAGNSPDLPDDTRSRCIRVLLLPDHDGAVEDSDWQFIEDDAALLREQIEDWADVVRNDVATLRPEYPAGLRGRNRERWAPLLKIATVAGGPWPDRCLSLIAADLDDQDADREAGIQKMPRHVQLLRDIADVWNEHNEDFYPTGQLLDGLRFKRPEYWGALNQFGALTPQGMGRMLSDHFNIRSARQQGNRSTGGRGYYLRFFINPWQSFGVDIPSGKGVSGEPVKPANSGHSGQKVTAVTGSDHSDRFPRGVPDTGHQTATDTDPDPLDPDESDAIGVIVAELSKAGDSGMTAGKILREVKKSITSPGDVFALLDEMVSNKLIRVDDGQRYYHMPNEEAAA